MRHLKWGDIATLHYGKGLRDRSEEQTESAQYRVYGTNGPIGWCEEPIAQGPAIIVGRKGAYRGIEYTSEPFYVIDTAYYLELTDNLVDMEWAYYKLLTYDINRMDSGSAIPSTKREDFYSLPVDVPDLSSQQRATDILSAFDDLIEVNRQRIERLERAARLLYREWFVHHRFPGHEHAEIVDGVPEGWEHVAATDIIDVKPKMPTIDDGKEAWYVPMAALSETGTSIDLSEARKREKQTSVRFQNGDVLFARITPCLENGKTALVQFLNDGEIATGSTEFIVLRGDRVSSAFTYCMSRTYDFRHNAIKSMTGSSGRQRVQTECFDRFTSGLPPQHLLDEFDTVAEPCFEKIHLLQQQNRKLKQARDTLLPRLMSGEIKV